MGIQRDNYYPTEEEIENMGYKPLYNLGDEVKVKGNGVGLSGVGTVISIGGTTFDSQYSYKIKMGTRTEPVDFFEDEILGKVCDLKKAEEIEYENKRHETYDTKLTREDNER